MIKALIIEDEKPAARRLGRLLSDLDIDVLTLLHSVKQSIDWLQSNPAPDLIFLDIQLSDGLSFEIFEQVTCQSPIIFTTAYDSYTLKAFKLNSVDYLLKPINEDELSTAVHKFKHLFNKTSTNHNTLDIEQIKAILYPKPSYKERLTIYTGNQIKVIETDNIAFIYSQNHITHCHTFDHSSHIIDSSLEQLSQNLNTNTFFKLNRKHIINIKAIDDILYHSNHRLMIKTKYYTEEPIIVSRERVKAFKNWLEQ